MTTTNTPTNHAFEEVLSDCAAALKRIADYRLPQALDRRLLWLSENKERLTEIEKEELFAAIEFAEERTVEKLQAQAVLQKLAQLSPDLVSQKP